ncbi:glycosyltransferase family A protein [Halomonas sp. THAF12]|uniref:glycosyltransferase family A protein n=1 Tax=Halomonas sp. B23F22_10 TaxID=3459515 RepID=UPI00373E89EF
MPQFSLVMPVYNKEAVLASTLACVYEQTLHDYELIVVDDGSTDGSLALLEREAELGRLRLLKRDAPGHGGYAARNHGALSATGRWLVFFGAGDMLLFDHLSQFADAILAHPQLELFINAYQMMDDHQRLPKVAAPAPGVLSRQQALAALARSDFIHLNGACIRRERFQSLGGFPDGRYRRGGDAYFWLKALCSLDAIHYDATVTSLCMVHRAEGTSPAVTLQTQHPWLDVRDECETMLNRCERHYLRAAVNRKVLAWAMEKRRLGQSVRGDLRCLRLTALRPSHLYQALSLLTPVPLARLGRRS